MGRTKTISNHGYSTTGLDSGKKICNFLEDTSNTNNAQSGHEIFEPNRGEIMCYQLFSCALTCITYGKRGPC